jgi:UDP-2-acetamido-2-deoxy-ribo-hexuluronate aminotransferase
LIPRGDLSVLDHGQYIMGPEIRMLEQKLADFTGVKHTVSCASGTDALLIALMANGVGSGHAVFTSPFTFIATAEYIDPGKLEKAINSIKAGNSGQYPVPRIDNLKLKPRAIICVDLFGLPTNYSEINSVASKFGLFVIEDAAQSFGAEYEGRKTCSLTDVGCMSFSRQNHWDVTGMEECVSPMMTNWFLSWNLSGFTEKERTNMIMSGLE